MGKPYHFNLLYKLFVNNSNNWKRLTLGTKSKEKWKSLKNYILSSVDSHQYGEFLYLLKNDWVKPVCSVCGKQLKYNYGYKTYCSRKCARSIQLSSNTIKTSTNTNVTIDKTDLSIYDNEYIPLLIINDVFTSLILTIRTSKDKKYSNIKYWLNHRISWAKTWKETIYCVYHKIDEQPKCEICKKYVTFKNFKTGYRKYCSHKCAMQDNAIRNSISLHNINNGKLRGEKISATKQKRTKEQIDKEITKSKKTRQFIYGDENFVNPEKTKQTNLERWGHKCTLHSKKLKGTYDNSLTDEHKKHLSEIRKEYWGNEKYRNETINKLKEAQKNLSEEARCSKLNGYHNWWDNISEEERIRHNKKVSDGVRKWSSTLTDEQKQQKLDKEYITKEKHGTFNTSNSEDYLATYISKVFPDMKRQYKSKLYPKKCDYYIPCIDTYIELQGSWTHGGHPYGSRKNDVQIVEMWKNKNTQYYNNAVLVWTKSDVEKREIAKRNNLKFYELWGVSNKDMIKHYKFIDKLYEEYRNSSK